MSVNPVGFDYFGVTLPEKKQELGMDTFMRLLTVQLANQNPLEPMNDRDFFAQMAQLGTVQGVDKLRESMNITQAATLMGKSVTALRGMTDEGNTDGNATVTGKVKRLTMRNGEQFLGLEVQGGGIVDVRMNAIREIND